MKGMIAMALAASVALVGMTAVTTPVEAAQGCGPGGHRGPAGRCRPNRGPVVVAPNGALIIGRHYPGRGYWDGRRYYQQRYRYHNGWRYR